MTKVRSILSFALAALVLISSTNFIVGMHFCRGKIKNLALFSKADGCDNEKQLPPCHRHETPSCCQDEIVIHEGQDFKNSITEFNFFSPLITCLAPPVLISELLNNQSEKGGYTYYDPPIRTLDLNVIHEVFLI